jgi:hypothetical protein
VARIRAIAAALTLLLVAGCGGDDDGPPEPETVQDAVTLGILRAAKTASFGTSQLASEFCDLAGVTTEQVRARSGGEPPIKFTCTLTYTVVNNPTSRYSVDYRTTLDSEGCFHAIRLPGTDGGNEVAALDSPASLAGCVDLPEG